jgi:hypothetical protein
MQVTRLFAAINREMLKLRRDFIAQMCFTQASAVGHRHAHSSRRVELHEMQIP